MPVVVLVPLLDVVGLEVVGSGLELEENSGALKHFFKLRIEINFSLARRSSLLPMIIQSVFLDLSLRILTY